MFKNFFIWRNFVEVAVTRLFRIEPSHRKIISKSVLLKALTYLDKSKEETPYLLMDKDQLKKKALAIGKNIRNSQAFYAVKANPSREVVGFLDEMGMSFEIASEGELQILAERKVAPERIITSNPVKSFKFLRMAAKYGVKYYSFDSFEEADKMARFVPKASVYVRLTVPNEGSEWPLSKKFGVEVAEGLKLILYAKEKGLDMAGITFHVGSQCTNIHNWDNAIHKAKTLWDEAEKKGVRLRLVNIGGGYPIKYTKDVVNIEEIEKNIDKLIRANFPPDVEVFIEPGRAIVGDAGIFVTSVIGKTLRTGDEHWLHLDVGVFNGLMESVGGIKYTYIQEKGESSRRRDWTVSGPSCDSFDVIDKNVTFIEPEVGSLVLVLSSGAYTVSYASEFNGFSIPKTVLI